MNTWIDDNNDEITLIFILSCDQNIFFHFNFDESPDPQISNILCQQQSANFY